MAWRSDDALMLDAKEIEARVRDSFARQSIMTTLGAEIAAVRSGEVEIVLPFSDKILQQHDFIHAGAVATIADSACGYAALSVMPRDAAVLTTEFKIQPAGAGQGRTAARHRPRRPQRQEAGDHARRSVRGGRRCPKASRADHCDHDGGRYRHWLARLTGTPLVLAAHNHYIAKAGLWGTTGSHSPGPYDPNGSCPWPGSWARSYGAHLLM